MAQACLPHRGLLDLRLLALVRENTHWRKSALQERQLLQRMLTWPAQMLCRWHAWQRTARIGNYTRPSPLEASAVPARQRATQHETESMHVEAAVATKHHAQASCRGPWTHGLTAATSKLTVENILKDLPLRLIGMRQCAVFCL